MHATRYVLGRERKPISILISVRLVKNPTIVGDSGLFNDDLRKCSHGIGEELGPVDFMNPLVSNESRSVCRLVA